MPSATETVTTLSSVIALGRYQATGNGNSGVAAYCVAGDKSAGNTNKVEKISYTSDSVSTMGNNLPGYYYGGGQGTNQGSKAYYMGGNKYPITATVYGMPFSTETWASLSNDLTYNPLTFSSCSEMAQLVMRRVPTQETQTMSTRCLFLQKLQPHYLTL